MILPSTARSSRFLLHLENKQRKFHWTYASIARSDSGVQPALHFEGVNFDEISFDDVIVLIQPWYNFFADGHR